jgi:hypothetical protein
MALTDSAGDIFWRTNNGTAGGDNLMRLEYLDNTARLPVC